MSELQTVPVIDEWLLSVQTTNGWLCEHGVQRWYHWMQVNDCIKSGWLHLHQTHPMNNNDDKKKINWKKNQ